MFKAYKVRLYPTKAQSELIDYKHGEDVRPVRLVYQAQGNFVEVLKDTLGGSWA